ncbi:MAG: RNA polymerase subunit sigma-70 [Myxococcota bacterium]
MPEPRDTQTEQAIDELVARAIGAWPDLDLDPDSVRSFFAAKLEAADGAGPDGLRASDLYLVHGCLVASPEALRAFDRGYLADLPAVLSRLNLSREEADEVRQRLRQRLLLPHDDRAPKLAAYAGRGELRNFVRTAAVRLAHNFVDGRRRETAAEPEALERALGAGSDLQLDFLRNEYGAHFKDSFEVAVTKLSARDRNLLRFHYIDGLTSDALGAAYGVHRATAARWVAAARERLAAQTRTVMMARLQVGRADLQSIMRLIHSQLDASVRRCLGDAKESSQKSCDGG